MCRLDLGGRVDIAEVRTLHARARAAYDQPGDVLVDWRDVELLDAAALQVVLALHQALAAAGRRLVVTPPPPPVAETLALAGVTRTFTPHEAHA